MRPIARFWRGIAATLRAGGGGLRVGAGVNARIAGAGDGSFFIGAAERTGGIEEEGARAGFTVGDRSGGEFVAGEFVLILVRGGGGGGDDAVAEFVAAFFSGGEIGIDQIRGIGGNFRRRV